MITKMVRNALVHTYPIFIIFITLAVWGCSYFTGVAQTPSAVADGFNFDWKPEFTAAKPCEEKLKNSKQAVFASCSLKSGSNPTPTFYSDNSKQ